MLQHRQFNFFIFIILLSLVTGFLSISLGSATISFSQIFTNGMQATDVLLIKLRLQRTLAAFVSGGLLSLAGAYIQLLLQNPLADPYAMGISGGAACITLLALLLGASETWLLGSAWIGSLITVLLIFLLAKKHQWQTQTLLLCGIALACLFTACNSFILLITPDSTLHSMLFWLSGDLNDTEFPWFGLVCLISGGLISWYLAPGLNILGRGEKEAKSLGLSTTRYRIILYLLSSLFTATAVTLAGCIGFIGLIIPHLTRSFIAYDHRIQLPASILLGGTILAAADLISRVLFAPLQIPVGIVMALFGVPIFIWLLHK